MKQKTTKQNRTTVFRVNKEKCTGCGLCAESCPHQAVSLSAGYAYIHQTRCRRCGLCADVCPQGAIREVTPVSLPELNTRITSLKERADDIIARINVLKNT